MDVAVRPARLSDRAPLMSFIKDVWGGHDYIPRVWDHWIRDPRNKMFVVTVDGTPVGMNRLRFMEDGSAWFEGARVHPDYRSQGLGSLLGENSMKLAKDLGITTFRLTSGSRNHTAHRQIARIKFKEVARFSVYEPPRRRRVRGRSMPVPADGARDALRAIRDSVEYRSGGGVYWHNWGAASLTPAVVQSLADEGAVMKSGKAVAVVRSGGEGGRDWSEVGFVGGPPAEATGLVKSVLGAAKTAEAFVFVPQGSPIIHALREAAFKRFYSNILFERRAAKG